MLVTASSSPDVSEEVEVEIGPPIEGLIEVDGSLRRGPV